MKLEDYGSYYEQLARELVLKTFQSIPIVHNVEITRLNAEKYDFQVNVFIKEYDSTLVFDVEVKSIGEPRIIKKYIEKITSNNGSNNLFVAPYISDASSTLLRENHVSYMDLSGNCFIQAGGLYIDVSGKPNKFIEKKEKKNYFLKSSMVASTILRTLLNDFNSVWQVRDISMLSNVAIGSVSNVKKFLIEHDWAEEVGKGFKVSNVQDLLQAWSKDYHKSMSHTIECYSFDSIPEIEKKIKDWNYGTDKNVLLGGFSAAARYAPTVRYNKVEIYVDLLELDGFINCLDLKKVDKGGNVIITIPHDKTPLMYSQVINGDFVTSPVQTVLDLLGNASRGEEAADAIILKEFR